MAFAFNLLKAFDKCEWKVERDARDNLPWGIEGDYEGREIF